MEIENDQSNCALFSATTMFKPKKEISSDAYYNAIAKYKILTPFVDDIDMNKVALIVVSFVFDNLYPGKIDITDVVGKEEFAYPINQYGLTKVNGAIFKKDGLIFDGKGYFVIIQYPHNYDAKIHFKLPAAMGFLHSCIMFSRSVQQMHRPTE